MKSYYLYILSFLFLCGCVHDQCNNVPQRPLASDTLPGALTPVPTPVSLPPDAIQIFKPTGEKQCSPDKGVSLEDMQFTLTQKKINVYESHTQPDGKMHMALCGSPSGTIHVFSIAKHDLKRAEKLGFRILENH